MIIQGKKKTNSGNTGKDSISQKLMSKSKFKAAAVSHKSLPFRVFDITAALTKKYET